MKFDMRFVGPQSLKDVSGKSVGTKAQKWTFRCPVVVLGKRFQQDNTDK